MSYEVDSIIARLSAVVDETGFKKFDTEVEKRRKEKVEAALGGKVDAAAFEVYNRQLDRVEARVKRREAFRAQLGGDFSAKAFNAYERELERAAKQTQQLGAKTDELRHKTSLLGHESIRTRERLGPLILSARGLTGALLGTGAVFGLERAVEITSERMGEVQKTSAQTGAVLKSTAGAAHVTREEVEKLSEAIFRKTGVDHEQIAAAENMLLTFRHVRDEQGKGNDIFKQGTRAIVDLSAAMHQDLAVSTKQVGKALEDPVRGMTALRRVGVAFSQDQVDMVKHLVATGDQLGAQKIILRELNKEFGGSAVAAGHTFPMAMSRLRTEAKDTGVQLLTKLQPGLVKGADAASKFIEQMRHGEGAGGRFAEQAKKVGEEVGDAAKWLGHAAKDTYEFGKAHPELVKVAKDFAEIAAAVKVITTVSRVTGITALIGMFAKLRTAAAGATAAEEAAVVAGGAGGAAGGGRRLLSRLLGGGAAAAGAGVAARGAGLGLAAETAPIWAPVAAGAAAGIGYHALTHTRTNFDIPTTGGGLADAFRRMENLGDSDGLDRVRKFGDLIEKLPKDLSQIPSGKLRGLASEADQLASSTQGIGTMGDDFDKAIKSLDDFANAARDQLLKRAAPAFEVTKGSAGKSLKAIRTAVKASTDDIVRELGNTAQGREALAHNFELAADAVKKSMHDGVISTKTGTHEINRLLHAALKDYGLSDNQASALMSNGTMQRKSARVPGQAGAPTFARGGFLEGHGLHDTVPVIAAPKEAFLTRHQQQPVEHALAFAHAMGATPFASLDDVFSRVRTPHYMATGGIVQRANQLDRMHLPYVWGGHHGDGGPIKDPHPGLDCSSAVSYVLGIQPRVSGELEHVGKPGKGPITIYANAEHAFMSIMGRGFGTSAENPHGGPGWLSYSERDGFVVRHVDGEGLGMPTEVRYVQAKGAAGIPGVLAQASLDRARAGANHLLRQAGSAFDGPGQPLREGASKGAGRTLTRSELERAWVAAGGDPRQERMAAAVALAESRGRVNARHVNADGSIDRGPWQINSVHGALSTFDLMRNAAAAVQISGDGTNWHPWTTFNTGAYRQFMARGGRVKGHASKAPAPKKLGAPHVKLTRHQKLRINLSGLGPTKEEEALANAINFDDQQATGNENSLASVQRIFEREDRNGVTAARRHEQLRILQEIQGKAVGFLHDQQGKATKLSGLFGDDIGHRGAEYSRIHHKLAGDDKRLERLRQQIQNLRASGNGGGPDTSGVDRQIEALHSKDPGASKDPIVHKQIQAQIKGLQDRKRSIAAGHKAATVQRRNQVTGVQGQITAVEKTIRADKSALAKLKKAIDGLRSRKGDIDGKLEALPSTMFDQDQSLQDLQAQDADVPADQPDLELDPDEADAIARIAGLGPMSELDRAGADASLTDTLDDDLAAAAGVRDYWQYIVRWLKESGAPSQKITAAENSLKSALDGVSGAQQALVDQRDQMPQGESDELDAINKDIALAALTTDDLTDDQKAGQRLVGFWSNRLDELKRFGASDPAITDAAQQLKSAQDATPTADDIAKQVQAQFDAFQSNRAQLFANFGSNFAAVDQRLFSDATGQAAGMRFFGAAAASAAQAAAGPGPAAPVVAAGGTYVEHAEFHDHYDVGPDDPHLRIEQTRFAVGAAFP